jgi:hypothetical protein
MCASYMSLCAYSSYYVCVSTGDTLGRNSAAAPRLVRKERLLHAGTVFGLVRTYIEE